MDASNDMGFLDKIRVKEPAGKVTDPVCGMTIDPKDAAGTSQVEGKTYHFCNAGCKRKFDAAPMKYLAGERDASHG